MKLQVSLLLFGVLMASSCKKVTVGGSKGSGSATEDEFSGDLSEEEEVLDEEALGDDGTIDESVEPSVAEETFSLTKFLNSRKEPGLEGIKKKLDPELTKIVVGDPEKFSLETNTSVKIDPAEDSPEGERKLEARFWVDAYMFKKKIKNIGTDSQSENFMEAQGTATLDQLGMEAFYRYLGVDVATRTITAGWEPRYTRDNDIKFGANAVVVGAEVNLRMGGEVAVKFEFGVRRDGVLNLIFTPQADITAGVSGEVKVLAGVGSAGPKGVTSMMKYIGRGNANIGFIKQTNMIYADIGMDPGSMTFTDGKVDIVASSLGRTLWTKNVYDPQPLLVKKIPQYGSAFTKYVSAPDDCAYAASEAERILNIGIVKMKAYREAVAEEDKAVITTGINRMNELKQKAKSCS